MSDIVDLNPPRRIKDVDEDGNLISNQGASPSSQDDLHEAVDTIADILAGKAKPPSHIASQQSEKFYQNSLNHHNQTPKSTPTPHALNSWGEQLLVQELKKGGKPPSWLQNATQFIEEFKPKWTALKLCAICTMNLVPEQYLSSTKPVPRATTHTPAPYYADELGRRFPI